MYSPQIILLLAVVVLMGLALVVFTLARKRRRPVVIDGSNVLHWRDNSPSLEPVLTVIRHLKTAGFHPGIVFDANVGYMLAGRYLNERHLARLIGLPASRVLVVAKGQPADPTILAAARDMGAPIVSNDRFTEWRPAHPELSSPGKIIRGGLSGRPDLA